MAEGSALATIRASMEAILPSVDGSPDPVALGVEQHVVEQLELIIPGFPTLIGALLDAYAASVRPEGGFAGLSLDERREVLREMGAEESQEIREAVAGLFVFTLGGVYSEWSGYDRDSGRLEPPASWAEVGYPGPSLGHPDYRRDA
jgi:hypothetical protein